MCNYFQLHAEDMCVNIEPIRIDDQNLDRVIKLVTESRLKLNFKRMCAGIDFEKKYED